MSIRTCFFGLSYPIDRGTKVTSIVVVLGIGTYIEFIGSKERETHPHSTQVTVDFNYPVIISTIIDLFLAV